jgi:hypothetical protein
VDVSAILLKMNTQYLIARGMLFLLLLGVGVRKVGAQTPVLGLLEEIPGVYEGEGSSRHVRVVFRKDSQGWLAFPCQCPDQPCLKTISSEFPRAVNWTISFDGRKVGKITARTPGEFKFYSHVGLQEIVNEGTIPTVGKRSLEFSGYRETPVHRPLIANAVPYFEDPDSWKPAQPTPEYAKLLRGQFRQKFPRLCRISKQDETKLETLPYRDGDIATVKGYRSRRGWWVVRLHLEGAVDCNDVEAGFEIDDSWFTIDPQHAASYLDSGMWLVDAGDFDNDGKSELVFSIDRDNRGGYVLYYDDFRKHATFEYGYH